jgi:hypothetical protein
MLTCAYDALAVTCQRCEHTEVHISAADMVGTRCIQSYNSASLTYRCKKVKSKVVPVGAYRVVRR